MRLTQTSSAITREYLRDLAANMIDETNAISHEYFETRFRVHGPAPLWPKNFVIISACATTGESWTEEETAVADRNLARVLEAGRNWITRVVGFSPITGHAEPSWAVDIPVDKACGIGLRFRQDAIYQVDHDDLFVLLCRAPSVCEKVGSFRQRLEAGSDATTA